MSEKIDRSIDNHFEKELIDNGYKIFSDSLSSSLRLFQKCIRDDIGKCYYINISHYNLKRQQPHITIDSVDTYQVSAQFEHIDDGKEQTIDFKLNMDFIHNKYRPISSLSDAERELNKVWKLMGYEYYEKYVE